MDETAPRGHAARLLAVLAVLLGLLAMHGVASAHHAAATPATDHAAAPDATTPAVGGHADDRGAAAQTPRPGATALAGPAGASCDDDCLSAAAVLCVAVLTGAALALLLALLLARRRAAPLLPEPAGRGGTDAPAPPVRHARGPDPVRELCVSRT